MIVLAALLAAAPPPPSIIDRSWALRYAPLLTAAAVTGFDSRTPSRLRDLTNTVRRLPSDRARPQFLSGPSGL